MLFGRCRHGPKKCESKKLVATTGQRLCVDRDTFSHPTNAKKTMTAIPLTPKELDKLAKKKKKKEQKDEKKKEKDEKDKKKKKKKKKEKKKEKKRKRDDLENVDDDMEQTVAVEKEEKEEKEEEEEEEKKTKNQEDTSIVTTSNKDVDTKSGHEKEDEGSGSRRRRSRRSERERLREGVPKTDENGIAYTKMQIRRMMKRVKRGLPPVPTAQEERERLQREAQLRREEEAELAGFVYHRQDERGRRNDDDDEEEEEEEDELEEEEQTEGGREEEDDDQDGQDDDDDEQDRVQEEEDEEEPSTTTTTIVIKNDKNNNNTGQDKKRRRRQKPVPADYVCWACQNRHTPPHWIYDCPDKDSAVSKNKKKNKGIHEPDPRRVFVSGLPFSINQQGLYQLFLGAMGNTSNTKIVQTKIITFPDTGRCKGQAIVTFDTPQMAQRAIQQLNGTTIPNDTNNNNNKKENTNATKRKELKLKVTQVLNRTMTKKSKAT